MINKKNKNNSNNIRLSPGLSLHLLLIVLLLFLTSCGSTQDQSTSYNFKQGFGGLDISFLENAPPSEVYPNSEFKMIAKLENKGAYDLKDGKIALVGNIKEYLDTNFPEQSFSGEEEPGLLKGRSLNYPAGEVTFVEFLAFSKDLYLNAREMPLTYFIKAGYQSEFEFADTICLNPNLYAVYDSGCQVESEKSYSGQGAPVAVNELQELITPGPSGQVEFRFKIGNKGSGRAKWLELLEAKLGGKEINCYFKDIGAALYKINFPEEEGQETVLICRQPIIERNSYATSLYLHFAYGYELKKEQKIKLVR